MCRTMYIKLSPSHYNIWISYNYDEEFEMFIDDEGISHN
jgi:hypothetical protein